MSGDNSIFIIEKMKQKKKRKNKKRKFFIQTKQGVAPEPVKVYKRIVLFYSISIFYSTARLFWLSLSVGYLLRQTCQPEFQVWILTEMERKYTQLNRTKLELNDFREISFRAYLVHYAASSLIKCKVVYKRKWWNCKTAQ